MRASRPSLISLKSFGRKRKARAWKVSGTQGKFSILKLLFTISLAGIRTKQILREKAGCKQSRKTFLNVWNKHDLKTRNVVRRDLRVCLNNRGFLCRALVTMPRVERSKLLLSESYFFPRHTFRGQEDGPCILGNYFLKIKILVSFVFSQDHF